MSEAQTDRERLIGSWRHIGTTVDGKPRPGQGAHPKGIIIYDPHGYMACQVAPDRQVTHHRQGSVQPGDTADLVRGYELVGDRLILRPLGTAAEVTWERIR